VKICKITAAVSLAIMLMPWVAVHAAQQDTAIKRMHEFLLNVHSLKADFNQVVLDANLETVKI